MKDRQHGVTRTITETGVLHQDSDYEWLCKLVAKIISIITPSSKRFTQALFSWDERAA